MRDAFQLDPSVVHLNHGSFGAVPRVVAEAQQRVRDGAEANPMRFFRVDSPGLKVEAREVGAAFLGVDADELALVRNVTTSAAIVLGSLAAQGRLGPGDVVLLGEPGYESVRRTVDRWCARTGSTYVVVPVGAGVTDHEVVRAFEDAVAQAPGRVRLVVVDAITSPTGAVLPYRAICELARAAGALSMVDAAHVPGHVPALPADSGADFWTGTWHKWCFAPRGTTALWAAEPERATLQPLTTSWNHGQPYPLPFDTAGTDDYSGWYALGTAIRFWEDAGGLEIGKRASSMLDDAAALLSSVVGSPSDVPVPACPSPSLRLVPLPHGVADDEPSADRLYQALSAQQVEEQVVSYRGHGYVRLSGAVYNEPSDYERLADILPGTLAG
ncbi:MAG: aminotransferase class V-fold PLP-dependent enzyme [Nocardioidaceae bacterium]|nr:aminotransferase class V-fold PLP-dependent enzyme [Nocardioidaceae bacterium]